MKRCPTCNLTFEEDWLAFCTQDGTTLVEESPSQGGLPPTIATSSPTPFAPPPPMPSAPPAFVAPPPPFGGAGSAQFGQPQPVRSGWQPPPPPAYATPATGMALASAICGAFSMTGGLCCYLGMLSAPVAIALGAYQLVQIKNQPDRFGGKSLAITGVITGSLYFVIIAVVIILYGGLIFLGQMAK